MSDPDPAPGRAVRAAHASRTPKPPTPAAAFEPQHADPTSYKLHSVWSGAPNWAPSHVEQAHAGKLLTIHLAPFEALTLSAIPTR